MEEYRPYPGYGDPYQHNMKPRMTSMTPKRKKFKGSKAARKK